MNNLQMAKSTSVEDDLKQKVATKQAELKALQTLEDSHVAHIKKVHAMSQKNNICFAIKCIYLSPAYSA